MGVLFFNGLVDFNGLRILTVLPTYLIAFGPSIIVGFFFVNYFSLRKCILDNRKPIISLKYGLIVGVIVGGILFVIVSIISIILTWSELTIPKLLLLLFFYFVYGAINSILIFLSSIISLYMIRHLRDE
tara:strand:+ start:5279 stop:5665 length:387 start_codon:yes stop_codon:yes gene_type:complete